MPNLLATLNTAAQTLRTFDRALAVTQNNVQNSQTPGYAKQRQTFDSLAFDPPNGLLGGVKAGPISNSRDRFAEQLVHRLQGSYGFDKAKAQGLQPVDGVFNLQAGNGIAAQLQQLSASFSAWSVSPNSQPSRQTVIDQASGFAGALRDTFHRIQQEAASTERRVRATVTEVNHLASLVRDYNVAVRRTGASDAGSEAALYETLEKLSFLLPVTPLYQQDGSVTLLTSGESPLVIGEDAFPLSVETSTHSVAFPDGLSTLQLIDGQGNAITAALEGGELGGLLDLRNRVFPSLIGGGDRQGSLNRFAQSLADKMNGLLTAGQTADGSPGSPLFTYEAARPAAIAGTIAVALSDASGLAAISSGPPVVANGVASSLALLAASPDPANQIDGQSYETFFANLAAGIGREVNRAAGGEERGAMLAAQARTLRGEISGVSLDEEAAQLLALQRSYEAAARMVTVVDELTQTILNMVR